MSRQKRAPTLGDSPVVTAKGGARDRLRDAGSKELARLAKKVGNGQVGALLGSAKEKRDALLAFIQQRLAAIQAVQQAEQKEMADRREWWLQVARGKPGFTLPDPTRWHKAALLYKRAAEAVCAGDLGRGGHLLDAAVRAERAAFETVPTQVDLPSTLSAPTAAPDERPFVDEGETAPPTQAPAVMKTADTILRVTTTSDAVPVLRNNPVHHWWDAPEEEKPADAKKDGKKPPSTVEDATPEKAARDERAADRERERVEERAKEPTEDAGVRAVRQVGVRTDPTNKRKK